MLLTPEAETHLRSFLKDDFIIKFSAEYGAENSAYRNLIRQEIFDRFGYQFTSEEKENFFDLKQIPRIPGLFLSVSHTADAGVWIVGPQAVGVDIEKSERLSEKLIARVSSSEEMSLTEKKVGSWKVLWTAKESAFKALNAVSGPQVMSEIEIHWDKFGDLHQGAYFEASHNQTNKKISCKGISFLSHSHALSVAILNH